MPVALKWRFVVNVLILAKPLWSHKTTIYFCTEKLRETVVLLGNKIVTGENCFANEWPTMHWLLTIIWVLTFLGLLHKRKCVGCKERVLSKLTIKKEILKKKKKDLRSKNKTMRKKERCWTRYARWASICKSGEKDRVKLIRLSDIKTLTHKHTSISNPTPSSTSYQLLLFFLSLLLAISFGYSHGFATGFFLLLFYWSLREKEKKRAL